jgi:hypothetical protein
MSKKITVKTQAQLDKLPDLFDEYTYIHIESKREIEIVVNQRFKNAEVRACDSSQVTAYGSSQVTACDSSQVTAYGSSQVTAYDFSQVRAYGSSQVTACDSSQVRAYDFSQVRACDSSQVTAYGSSQVRACDSSQVTAYGSSQVTAYDFSQVRACDSSQVTACDSSQVRAYGSSQVRAFQASMIRVEHSSVKVHMLKQYAVAMFMETAGKVGEKDDTATVIVTPRPTYTKEIFCDIYRDRIKDGAITLYKSVNPETLCDFHTGKIKYSGVVTCPDWNSNDKIQCGYGLHLSPEPHMALHYNNGKILECSVKLEDFVVYAEDITKVRCREVTAPEAQ